MLTSPNLFQRLRQSPLVVGLVAFLGYLLILGMLRHPMQDFRDFALIGKVFIERSTASPFIRPDPTYQRYLEYGYDGQFFYFIALDPVKAHYYFEEVATYRYTRILYPLAARLLALGQPNWIPFSLVLLNWLAIAGGSWAMAAWLKRQNLSPWLALVYTFYVGQVQAFSRDLSENLAYALLIAAIYWLGPKRQLNWRAAVIFALAGLARETTLVFPAIYALYFGWFERDSDGKRWRVIRKVLLFGLIAAGPAIGWQLILQWWRHESGLQPGTLLFQLPLSGLFRLYPFNRDALDSAEFVLVPALICLVVGLKALWQNPFTRRQPEIGAMLVNALLFGLMLPAPTLVELFASARTSIGILIAALYSLPYLKGRYWFWLCAGLWLVPTLGFLLNPAVALFKKN